MKITHRRIAESFYDALLGVGEAGQGAVISRFVSEIVRQGSLNQIDKIVEAFKGVAHERAEGRSGLIAEAAHDITLPGADVRVRQALIAGVRLRRGDVVVDASVSGRLNLLRNTLNPRP